jgi:hypothetical protein
MKAPQAAVLAALLAGAPAALADDVVIAAAGDIACDPVDAHYNGGAGTAAACRMKATSDLLVGANYDAVLLLGDIQYVDGALWKFRTSFDLTWGRLGPLLRPVPGNHEYVIPGASGYFDYFGPAAASRSRGYYSFDLGSWHVIALNSNCNAIGGCGPGSTQLRWLEADLAAHPGVCTLAYWHHPRFSSGLHGDDPNFDGFWRALYAAGADVVLVGHDHNYERFAPQDAQGRADPARGLRQFVVGTGGHSLRPFGVIRPNSVARNSRDYGVLEMTLRPTGYDWEFLPAAGGTFTDRGSATCHNPRDPGRLSLDGGRFEARVTWKDFAGNTGAGTVVPVTSPDSGLFWFFHPDNWELMVKVLDGCASNGHHWVFAAATTNVEYVLTVTDTWTRKTRTYENPLGRTSPAITDTAAFPDCP